MKTRVKSVNRRGTTRWLVAGATALTLTLLGGNAHAATPPAMATPTPNQSVMSGSQAATSASQVTLAPTTSPAEKETTGSGSAAPGSSAAASGAGADTSSSALQTPVAATIAAVPAFTPVTSDPPENALAPSPAATSTPDTTTVPTTVTPPMSAASSAAPSSVSPAVLMAQEAAQAAQKVDAQPSGTTAALRPTRRVGATRPVKVSAANAVVDELADTLASEPNSIDEWLPNTRLQKIILQTLQRNNPGQTWTSVDDITQADMALLTRLVAGDDTYIDGHTPYSLEGLQYAVNLDYLMLQSRVDTAYFGDIVDISPFASLKNLTGLHLSGNRIEDITPLAGLTKLTELGLNFNYIGDFSSLKDHQFKSFSGGQQVIYLPRVRVNEVTRTAHLAGGYKLRDGSVGPLTGRQRILVPVRVNVNTGRYVYKAYYTGGNPVSTSDGGVDYNTIQDPGQPITALPDQPNIDLEPVDQHYYLTGTYLEGASPYFYVIQPYDLAAPAATVTAQHQDTQGEKLAEDVVLNADGTHLVGDPYTTEALTLPGYVLHATTGAAPSGTYAVDPQVVTYTYEAETQAQSTVTVHYVDNTRKVLRDPLVLSGKLGEAYTTEAATIPGYKLTGTPANASGVYTTENSDVVYTYQAEDPGVVEPPVETGTVTVHYVDQKGTPLRATTTLSGTVGTPYSTEAATISGYEVLGEPTNATGTYTHDPQTVTYVYVKLSTGGGGDEGTPEEPTPPTPPTPTVPQPGPGGSTGGSGNQGGPGQMTAGPQRPGLTTAGAGATVTIAKGTATVPATRQATTPTTTLPQTNEKSSTGVIAAGLALLTGLLGRLGWRRRKL
ncbi:MucBP domain-containing protein [Levilactobacillus suantsaii]|nr:MucBP domain-containing protein [Levilactobacillus suantsaii]